MLFLTPFKNVLIKVQVLFLELEVTPFFSFMLQLELEKPMLLLLNILVKNGLFRKKWHIPI